MVSPLLEINGDCYTIKEGIGQKYLLVLGIDDWDRKIPGHDGKANRIALVIQVRRSQFGK